MSTKRTYKVMNTSTAFLEYLKEKAIDHNLTEDGKMTVLRLYSDTDLFEVSAHYSRREALKAATEAARIVDIHEKDYPGNWMHEVEWYNPNGPDRIYAISKNSILNSII